MARYRYRTQALAGRWRDSRIDAMRDAVKARQAMPDEGAPDGLKWLVPGEIESDGESGPELKRRISRQ